MRGAVRLGDELRHAAPPVRRGHRLVPGRAAPAGRRLRAAMEGSRSVALPRGLGGRRAGRRRRAGGGVGGQGLLRPGGPHRCARRPSRCTAASATRGSAWPTSTCGGPCCRATCSAGSGPASTGCSQHQGIGGRRWTSVTRPTRRRSGCGSASGCRPTTRACPPRRPTTTTGPGRRRGTSRSTTPASSACPGRRTIGGQELPSVYEVILDEELAAAGAPPRPSLGYLVQGILEHGSDDIQRRFLPGHRQRPRPLVPGLQRARRRLRPRLAAHPGRPRRRRVRHHRPQGLDELLRRRRLVPGAGPDRPRRAPSTRASRPSPCPCTSPGIEQRPLPHDQRRSPRSSARCSSTAPGCRPPT